MPSRINHMPSVIFTDLPPEPCDAASVRAKRSVIVCAVGTDADRQIIRRPLVVCCSQHVFCCRYGEPPAVMPSLNAATLDDVHRYNLGRILRLLHLNGAMSRARLTALTGLNRSTIKAMTSELVDAGLVRESEPVRSTGAGRPSFVVEPDPSRRFTVAIEIGLQHLTAVRVGLGGTILQRRPVHQVVVEGVGPTLESVEELVKKILSGASAAAVCVGVGIAVRGMITEDGSVRFDPDLGWRDLPLGRLLQDRLGGLPVTVGNDGDLGALGEHLRGAAVGLSDSVYLSGAVGISSGIIVGGRLLHGIDGFGGELAHMCVNPAGRLCRCGRRGCWETEIGAKGVLES